MNFARKSVIHENPLGSFTCRKAGTLDILFYFPSEGRHTENFTDARKIQQLRPGLNPRTRVPVASMLTIRPPKPSCIYIYIYKYIGIFSVVKAADVYGWRPTTRVVPNVAMIWGLNLPWTPRATSSCRGTPFLYFKFIYIYIYIYQTDVIAFSYNHLGRLVGRCPKVFPQNTVNISSFPTHVRPPISLHTNKYACVSEWI